MDLTQVQSGPSCTQLLAWLGAEVIKVEEPEIGDRTRTEMAHKAGVDSFYFLVFNANKKSVCLDLKSRRGRLLLEGLARVSDVVVENLAPGTMDRLGLGYQRVREINPSVVYASIKGFGSYGPYAGFKSFENVAQAMGGAMSTNGEGDGPPLAISVGVGDSGAGLHCAVGILAALHRRIKTGAGDCVEVSMQDSVASLTRIRMVETLATNAPARRAGNRVWGPPSLVFPCHPGGPNDYVTISIGGEAWDSLLAVVGRADLIGDHRYATGEARRERAEEVEDLIGGWTSTRTKHEVMASLNDLGIPCGAVLSTLEVLEDPHLRARETVVEVDDAERGRYPALGTPVKLASGTLPVSPAPLLGQHSEEVLSELLGIGHEELGRLRTEGVI